MKRRVLLSGLFAGLVIAGAAMAQDVVSNVVVQLQNQGYGAITQETTLLGRVRILAVRDDGVREIIINPNTGEILRDLWTAGSGVTSVAEIIRDGKPSGGGGPSGGPGNGDDDGTDDDGDDGEGGDDGEDGDDDGDDNSGSGSGDDDDDDDGESDDDDGG